MTLRSKVKVKIELLPVTFNVSFLQLMSEARIEGRIICGDNSNLCDYYVTNDLEVMVTGNLSVSCS